MTSDNFSHKTFLFVDVLILLSCDIYISHCCILCALVNLPENELDVFEMACLMEFYVFCPFSWCLFHNLYFYVRRITKGLVPLVKDHALLEHQLLLVLENQYNVLCSEILISTATHLFCTLAMKLFFDCDCGLHLF